MAQKQSKQEQNQGFTMSPGAASLMDKLPTTFKNFFSFLAGAGAWSPEKQDFIAQKLVAMGQSNPAMTAMFEFTNGGRFTDTEHAQNSSEMLDKAKAHYQELSDRLDKVKNVYDKKGNVKRVKTEKELKKEGYTPTQYNKDIAELGKKEADIAKYENELNLQAQLNARADKKLDMQQANLALKMTEGIASEWDKQDKEKQKTEEEKKKSKLGVGLATGKTLAKGVEGFGEGFLLGRRIRGY